MDIDWFGRKARYENEILSQRTSSIRTLFQNSHLLTAGAEYLELLSSRCNHRLPADELLSAVAGDVELLMAEDRQSGAFQLNPECRPLVLLVEFGYESILLATARLNRINGRDICEIKSHQRINGGASVLERRIIGWLCELAASQHPEVPLFKNPADAIQHFEPIARKIMKLTLNGAMDITLKERVVVNGVPLFCTIPFSSKAISGIFMFLLGEFGVLRELLKKFIKNSGIELEDIDRVVSAGITGSLPLLRNTLATATSRPVITSSAWYNSILSNEVRATLKYSATSVQIKIKPLPHTDPRTGLQWVRDGNLAGKRMTWDEAKKWAATLDYAGHRDWRLPTKHELELFVQKAGKRPSEWFNSNGFNNVQAKGYWSSSTYYTGDLASSAWYVVMDDGYVSSVSKDYGLCVWPVRGGQ